MAREIIAVILLITLTVGLIIFAKTYDNLNRDEETIDLIARAPENGNWYPSVIKLKKGRRVRIRIRNIETVTHGFAIPALGIASGDIGAGEVKVLEFIPDKEGNFDFLCTVWCSRHHLNMRGRIIVE